MGKLKLHHISYSQTRLRMIGSCLFLLLFGCMFPLKSQTLFPPLQVKNGLASNSIYAILEDRSGFMWFGTGEGLSRFDGYDFRNFIHEPDNPYSLGGNGITALYEDRAGKIWVGTFGGGLNIFDPLTDRFQRNRHDPDDPGSLIHDYAISVYEDQKGKIWVGTWGGLEAYDQEHQRFVHYRHIPGDTNSLKSPLVNTVYQDKGGTYWIGTEAGLDRMRPSGDGDGNAEYTHIAGTGLLTDAQANIPVKYLYGDPANDTIIWAALSDGIFRIVLDPDANYTAKSITLIQHDPDIAGSLSSKYISRILRDQSGTLWASSIGGGLNRLVESETVASGKLQFEHIRHDPNKAESLISDEIRVLYESPSGIKWLGCDLNGVQKWLPKMDIGFDLFDHRNWKPDDPQAASITSIFPAAPDSLWVGTYYGGLFRINPLTGERSNYVPKAGDPRSVAHSLVTAITRDQEGALWFGTFGGLNKWNPQTDDFITYRQDGKDSLSLSDRHIFSLYADGAGSLWIGTRGGGLNRMEISTETFTHYMHDPDVSESIGNNNVWLVIGDGKDGLWMSTDKGLEHFDPASQVFTHYKHDAGDPTSLSNNYVNSMLLDKKGKLWVGTNGSGLDLFQEATGTFVNYGIRDGLPNSVIYGILEDEDGRLWLSTNEGLSCFDPAVSVTSTRFAAFRNYDVSHGLQDNEFTMGAYGKDANGNLYVGGVKGFNRFDPDSLQYNKQPPPIHLTQLRILNQTVLPWKEIRKGFIPLKQSLKETKQLTLSYRENVISFDFAALNYMYAENNRYAYRMEGFDEDWVYTGNERRATYTNLDAGTYLFRVKGSNNDGVWNEEGVSLLLHITPPPWKSWWAYLLYSLIFVGLIVLYNRYRHEQREKELQTLLRIEQAKAEEREVVRENTAADFHDELGNKMTRISLFLELAKRTEGIPEALQVYLNQVEQNANALSYGIRDFIWALDAQKDSLYDLLIRIKDFGDELFAYTDVRFSCEGIHPRQSAYKLPLNSRRHLILIAKEAMNNSLKYAEAKQVWLRVEIIGQDLTIRLVDNGKGFVMNENRTGYGLTNIQSRAEKMGASAAIHSTVGTGTEIVVTWNLPNMGD